MNPYRLFSLLFTYPEDEVIQEIREASLPKTSPDYRSLELIRKVGTEDIQTEYTRLFVNAYPTLFCPPYESFYREGIIYGSSSVEVRRIYERHGLEYKFEGEPADHVSVELDFLALTKDDAFLNRFNEWISDFIRLVKMHSQIYGVFAEDLEESLKQSRSKIDRENPNQ